MTAKLTQSVKLRRASSRRSYTLRAALLHGLVRADDVDDAAGQEQACEANRPRRAQPDPD